MAQPHAIIPPFYRGPLPSPPSGHAPLPTERRRRSHGHRDGHGHRTDIRRDVGRLPEAGHPPFGPRKTNGNKRSHGFEILATVSAPRTSNNRRQTVIVYTIKGRSGRNRVPPAATPPHVLRTAATGESLRNRAVRCARRRRRRRPGPLRCRGAPISMFTRDTNKMQAFL